MKKFIIIIAWATICIVSSAGQSVLENFNTCAIPSSWESKKLIGNYQFKISQHDEAIIQKGKDCGINYIQEDRDDNSRRKFAIYTSDYIFDKGMGLSMLMKFKKATSSVFTINMVSAQGNVLLKVFTTDVKEMSVFSITLPILRDGTPFKIVFDYESTSNDYGAILIMDDIMIERTNLSCDNAIELKVDQPCQLGSDYFSSSTALNSTCGLSVNRPVYYKFTPDFTGTVHVIDNASYNSTIEIWEGSSCQSLQKKNCQNLDEFGFTGEKLEIEVEAGKTYFIVLSVALNTFGFASGTHCLKISKGALPQSKPANDKCESRIWIDINDPCSKTNNVNADWNGPAPSYNLRSRSDVWFSIKPSSTKPLQITSRSDYAAVISVFTGNCNTMTEIGVEDLEGQYLLKNPKIGQEYIIQISGYFSTIEGAQCVQVNELDPSQTSNDDCVSSLPLSLNAPCASYTLVNASNSTVKSSCTVYQGPDVWFKFVAGSDRAILLDLEADIMVQYAVFGGACNAMVELQCGSNIDPCEGPILIDQLTSGLTYFLQIMPDNSLVKNSGGNFCISIKEPSATTPYSALSLELIPDCIYGVLAKVKHISKGGSGMHHYYGPTEDEIFFPGQKIEAFVEDAKSCRAFSQLTVDCGSLSAKCKNSNLDIQLTTECIKDSIGRQTGNVILHISGFGGSGAYYLYGTPDGTQLKHGENYKIIIIDSDSCYVVEEGKVNCPPFDCSQSNLKVEVSVECIDTLFQARLTPQVSGDLGGFTVQQTPMNIYLDQGTAYVIDVKDAAGCVSQIKGVIDCDFDSCAYARPQLIVDYDCLKDLAGNNSGLARLNVHAESKVGGIYYIGNQPGDTLKNHDQYSIQMVDSFGCGELRSGTIQCDVLAEEDPSIKSNQFICKPNPVHATLVIECSNPDFSKIQFKMITSDGRKFEVNARQLNSDLFWIDVSHLVPGLYYLECSNKEYIEFKAVIKE